MSKTPCGIAGAGRCSDNHCARCIACTTPQRGLELVAGARNYEPCTYDIEIEVSATPTSVVNVTPSH